MDPFIAQIMLFGGNFAPRGWAFCDGQLLAISQNTALFSLIGTLYGGDGRTTFALPDLRGRVAVHPGTGPGLSNITLGERGGVENVGLNNSNLPAHTHVISTTLPVSANTANQHVPAAGSVLAPALDNSGLDATTFVQDINPANSIPVNSSIGATGGNIPFNIRNPYLGITHIIALQGIFPSRN